MASGEVNSLNPRETFLVVDRKVAECDERRHKTPNFILATRYILLHLPLSVPVVGRKPPAVGTTDPTV